MLIIWRAQKSLAQAKVETENGSRLFSVRRVTAAAACRVVLLLVQEGDVDRLDPGSCVVRCHRGRRHARRGAVAVAQVPLVQQPKQLSRRWTSNNWS